MDEIFGARSELAEETSSPLAPLWWQLYIRKDRRLSADQIKKAYEAKVNAIVVTVDVPALGNREADMSHPERLVQAGKTKYKLCPIMPLPTGQLEGE